MTIYRRHVHCRDIGVNGDAINDIIMEHDLWIYVYRLEESYGDHVGTIVYDFKVVIEAIDDLEDVPQEERDKMKAIFQDALTKIGDADFMLID
jgi:hypothetical protein